MENHHSPQHQQPDEEALHSKVDDHKVIVVAAVPNGVDQTTLSFIRKLDLNGMQGNGHAVIDDEKHSDECCIRLPCGVCWSEVRKQLSLAVPLIIGNLLSFCLQMISLTFIGHLGELELSGAAIANSFTTVTGFSVVLGMGCALETLCGQAYGARQYRKLGIYLQRAIFVLNLCAVPLAMMWANIEYILLALGQDAQIAAKAGAYGVYLIPTVFAAATYQPFVKYLQSQGIVAPMFIVSMITLTCHIPVCWYMVFKSGLGYIGAAVAYGASYWLNVILIATYVIFSDQCAKCRSPLTFEALEGLKDFFSLAIPSAAMLCLEWWSFEVLVIISGFLAKPQLQTAAISICVNSESLIYMLPMGLAAAASTRVSNELGAGHPEQARSAIVVALSLAFTVAIVIASILIMIRNVWGAVYSNEQEVVETVTGLVPILAISTSLDGVQGVLSGVAKGAGWQKAGAFINLASFYVAGLPLGCTLAFTFDMQGQGLWIGLTVGVFVQFVIFSIITYFTDWQKEANKAAEKIQLSMPETEPLLIK